MLRAARLAIAPGLLIRQGTRERARPPPGKRNADTQLNGPARSSDHDSLATQLAPETRLLISSTSFLIKPLDVEAAVSVFRLRARDDVYILPLLRLARSCRALQRSLMAPLLSSAVDDDSFFSSPRRSDHYRLPAASSSRMRDALATLDISLLIRMRLKKAAAAQDVSREHHLRCAGDFTSTASCGRLTQGMGRDANLTCSVRVSVSQMRNNTLCGEAEIARSSASLCFF